MFELFQTKGCLRCHGVRQRLAALGIDYVARQVPQDPADRDALEAATGVRTVPVLLFADGSVLDGAERILDYLATLPDGRLGAPELLSAGCDSTSSSRERESLLAGVPMS